jgi:hypothetical protein
MPGLGQYLGRITPAMHTSEMDMVIYWSWRTRPIWQKGLDRAWADLGMTPAHAQDAIDKKIVPMELYPKAVARALETHSLEPA